MEELGYFRIFATPPGGFRRDITLFRGAPIRLDNAVTADPFSHVTASLSLPQVTVFDNPGEGDLDWLVPDCDIDIVWQNTGPYDFQWSWEGYVASEQFSLSGSDSTFSIDLKGAFYGLDDYLAIPSHPKRPIPYEILIAEAFNQDEHPSRLGQFRVLFPQGWPIRVPEFNDPDYLLYLKPWGVGTNQLWTGFTSRSTGSWEPLLTGHVQSLLSVMFSEGGAQWSIRNRGQRRPELYLRRHLEATSADIIEIELGAPGVSFSGSKDFTQRASVIYGQGVDDAGISYSGMAVSPDGKTTIYRPFAYSPKVWPRLNNPNLDMRIKPKETMIRFEDGLDQVSALKVAQGQIQRFNEPGITGTIELAADVRFADGCLCPRMLIAGGRTIRIKGLFGRPEGVIAHVTNVQADFTNLTVTLTFDTKYRDELTVDEVRARTRDALNPLRALQVGKYTNTVQDLVLPWSYTEGSGCIPQASKEFFNVQLPSTAEFPYEEFTRKFPPKNPAYAPYYIKIGPVDTENANNNWSSVARDGKIQLAIPIRMGQAGTIKLTQVAAYDRDGNVLPVRFHLSVYGTSGIGHLDMPRFPEDPDGPDGIPLSGDEPFKYLAPHNSVVNYGVAQANPFFENAWETTLPDGTTPSDPSYLLAENADLKVGWGNYFEPAGYSPGRASRGAARTGKLEDNAQWTWDLSAQLDLQDPSNNVNIEYAGMLFVMIYCDEQASGPVFFMGRFFRQEPGVQ
jgi:hypothetical protein